VALLLGSIMNNFLSLVVAPINDPYELQSREVIPSVKSTDKT